jgi:hypothetical protein
VNNASLPLKQTAHAYSLMGIYDERAVDDTWGTILHLKVPDFIPLPERVQRLGIERLGTGDPVRFFVTDGVSPPIAREWRGVGCDGLLKTERCDKGETLSERTTT